MSAWTCAGIITSITDPAGALGEVFSQLLNDIISSTSANIYAVEALSTVADLSTAIAKINELIVALR